MPSGLAVGWGHSQENERKPGHLFPGSLLTKAHSGNIGFPPPNTTGPTEQLSPAATALAGKVTAFC